MSFRANAFFTSVLLILAGLLASAQEPPTLKDTFKDCFRVGAALNRAQIQGRDTRGAAIVIEQFNSISPEDSLKWGSIHPQPKVYDFTVADQYVAVGEKYHMFIVGHTLVWHNQTPSWVFQGKNGRPASRNDLLKRMREHIHKVVGRYKGRINGWDVVNEALADDGTLRPTPWLKIIGEDYIEKAFQYAHEADPKAELYYNDYSVENEAKRQGAVRLVARLQAEGVPITAVGLQGHDTLDWPTLEQEDMTLTTLANLGLKVMITELDVDLLPLPTPEQAGSTSVRLAMQPGMNPYVNGLPESVQQAQAKRYADLFGVFLKHRDVITRVTFWGVTDGDSWRNNFPVRGRTNYPLLFDRQGEPKPAFAAVIRAATSTSAGN